MAPYSCTVVKVIILGESGVGKTSLMNQYVKRRFHENCKATIGVDFMCKTLAVNGQDTMLQIWDTVGQERYRSLGVAFYRGADCCVLVYDVTDTKSFEALEFWHSEFLEQAAPAERARFPFLVLGNKIDVTDRPRVVSAENVHDWCAKKHIQHCFETSAKSAVNIEDAFVSIVRTALANPDRSFDDSDTYRMLHRNDSSGTGVRSDAQGATSDWCPC